MPTYREGYGPVTFTTADGLTTVEARKRKDGKWGWVARRGGRKVAGDDAGPHGMPRCRAVDAARRAAGVGARFRRG